MTATPPDEDVQADLPQGCRYALGCIGIALAAAGLLWVQFNRDFEETEIGPYLPAAGLVVLGCGALLLAWLSRRQL